MILRCFHSQKNETCKDIQGHFFGGASPLVIYHRQPEKQETYNLTREELGQLLTVVGYIERGFAYMYK